MYVSSGSVLEMGKEKCVRDQTWRSRSSNGTTRRPSYLSERHAPRAGHHPGFLGLLLLGLGDAMTSLVSLVFPLPDFPFLVFLS